MCFLGVRKHLCYQLYGVIRASVLRKIPPVGIHGAADAIFWLRLGIIGRFYEIREYLFFTRIHPQQSLSMFFPDYLEFTNKNPKYSINMLPDLHAYALWNGSAKEGKFYYLTGESYGNI
jgi:hypothetical protein